MENSSEEKKAKWIASVKISLTILIIIIAILAIVIFINSTMSGNSFGQEFGLLREKLGFLGKHIIVTLLLIFIVSLLLVYRETEYVDSDDERYFEN